MAINQQKEALVFFKKHAAEWKKKAEFDNRQEVNIIQQRNNYVLQVIKNRTATKITLDVGCGTGDLVCDIALQGIDSTGIDFAKEMIDIARNKARKSNLGKAHFYCCSIFDFNFSDRKYDVVSANGFIEYISYAELDKFLDLAYQALNPDGSLVIGSRNRLFNIFSLNEFTLDELNNGAIPLLLKEAVEIARGTNPGELAEMESVQLQNPESRHANTGIGVSTRYQFTPIQLIKMLKLKGFRVNQVYPIHIHGVPAEFKNKNKDVHTLISNLLQNFADNNISLVPFSSSFMLAALKAK